MDNNVTRDSWSPNVLGVCKELELGDIRGAELVADDDGFIGGEIRRCHALPLSLSHNLGCKAEGRCLGTFRSQQGVDEKEILGKSWRGQHREGGQRSKPLHNDLR